MKYYSETLDKIFNTEDELIDAETTWALSTAIHSEEKQTEQTTPVMTSTKSPSKKQLACEVEECEKKLKEARTDYEVARAQVEEISKKFLQDVDDILKPAEQAVKKAEQERYNAIKKFVDAYGTYQVSYTGDRAAQEMLRTLKSFNSIYGDMFKTAFKNF